MDEKALPPVKTTKYINENFNPKLNDSVARQYFITNEEADDWALGLEDPIGDHKYLRVKGIIHRYPDRCLLIPSYSCPVLCRFCFRKNDVMNDYELNNTELDEALDYISQNSDIWEVIISGGEPLAIPNQRLESILTRLNQIDHVRVLRIHTRLPMHSPQSLTPELLRTVKGFTKSTFFVIHCNHPDELTLEVRNGLKLLKDNAITILSQSVLLKGVNDNVDTLENLFKKLVENQVKPYYLHHCDIAKGTKHFRTTIKKGQELMNGLRGRISGLCIPTYILDIPQGFGKSPIGPNFIDMQENGCYRIRDFKGNLHIYNDPN